MKASSHCAALIKKYDGLATGAYFKNGQYVIGYGRRGVSRFDKITPHDAEVMLKHDLDEMGKKLEQALYDQCITVTQSQFDALLALSYAEGLVAVKKSLVWKYLLRHKPDKAAEHFLDFIYEQSLEAGKVKRPYLVARRKAEKQLFLEN